MTEKEKEKLLAYLIRIGLQAESEVQSALAAAQHESSVFISERLYRACMKRRTINIITSDICALLEI